MKKTAVARSYKCRFMPVATTSKEEKFRELWQRYEDGEQLTPEGLDFLMSAPAPKDDLQNEFDKLNGW